jgi:metal-sulfur cluster biosynthetic enzyme
MVTEKQVIEVLRPIKDPEIHISIVDLGLIYGVDVQDEGRKLKVRMTLTSPACPVGPELVSAVQMMAQSIEEVEDVQVEMVWDPPWDPKTMASDDAKDILGIW